MTIDTELETWRQEWRDQTEPLPDLKRKIKRQNRRMIAAVVTLCMFLAVSTAEALRTHNSFVVGLAAGLWFTSLLAGGYACWTRRGTWKPVAQTTQAYLELSYKRAAAKARTIRFSFYFLLIASVLYAGVVAFYWKSPARGKLALILAAMVAELFFIHHLGKRKKHEIEETKKLVEQTRESPDDTLNKRKV